jgi:molecular chaperone GrpE
MEESTVDTDQACEELQAQLETAQREAAENHDKYLRALAESENMRKRLQRLCEDRVWQEKKRLLEQFLEIADQLEEALRYASSDDPLAAGLRMTDQGLKTILAQEGVQPIESLGETFDPNRHEAVETTDDRTRTPNEVTQEYRKGYTLGDRLLRPARVEVNRAA